MIYIEKILPFGLVESYRKRQESCRKHSARKNFYQSFLSKGDLVFDIGANIGERVAAIIEVGCRVVAVEPQEECCKRIQKITAPSDRLTIIPKGCGAKSGTAVLKRGSGTDVLATISDDYIKITTNSGRFQGHQWQIKREVPICTAEELIQQYGCPKLIKIDVEGSEVEVFQGLQTSPEIVSFEFTPEMTQSMSECLGHCERLGLKEFNITWGESMRFSFDQWVAIDRMRDMVQILGGESYLFGDIFARRQSK